MSACGSRGVRSHIAEPYPTKLSAWKLFSGDPAALKPNAGVVPYDLNSRSSPTMPLSTGLSGCRPALRPLTTIPILSTFPVGDDLSQDLRLSRCRPRRQAAHHRNAPVGERTVRLGDSALCVEPGTDRSYSRCRRRPHYRALGSPLRQTIHHRLCHPQYQPMQRMSRQIQGCDADRP